MSVLRSVAASALAATALAVALPSPAAFAADAGGTPAEPGKASAVTAQLDLDVTLLNTVNVPVDVALNRVESPAQRDGAVLTATVDGVDGGRPVTLVKAEVGKSVTKADDRLAAASVKLVNADLHVPGLPLTTLLGLEAMSAEANCPVDGQPTADVIAPAKLTVLGKSVTVGLNSPTHVDVPAIGSVDVEFAKKTVTSSAAAAAALEVKVALNPLNLNVAKVNGTVTVASVSCRKPVAAVVPAAAVSSPAASPSKAPAAPASAQNRAVPEAAKEELAYTGSSGSTVLAAGGGTLLVAGAAAVWMTRRRRAAHARHR